MIRILYFAQFRERLNCESEDFQTKIESLTVKSLMQQLAERGEPWTDVFNSKQRILVAINQEMSNLEADIKDNDEVAFFPPITGG
jgi:molybdopterin synthase sulfur carrier subunit